MTDTTATRSKCQRTARLGRLSPTGDPNSAGRRIRNEGRCMHAFVRSWQTLTFPPITVVFFRIIGTKNTANEVREEEEEEESTSISTSDFYF